MEVFTWSPLRDKEKENCKKRGVWVECDVKSIQKNQEKGLRFRSISEGGNSFRFPWCHGGRGVFGRVFRMRVNLVCFCFYLEIREVEFCIERPIFRFGKD